MKRKKNLLENIKMKKKRRLSDEKERKGKRKERDIKKMCQQCEGKSQLLKRKEYLDT